MSQREIFRLFITPIHKPPKSYVCMCVQPSALTGTGIGIGLERKRQCTRYTMILCKSAVTLGLHSNWHFLDVIEQASPH
jgi:hypothetical protein